MAAVGVNNLPETTPALCDVRRGERLWWHTDQEGREVVIVRDDGVVVVRLPASGMIKTLEELKGERCKPDAGF